MKMNQCARGGGLSVLLAMAALLVWPAAMRGQSPVKLIPELRAGETMRYDIRGRVQRHVKEQSRVGTISTPGDVKQELSAVLHVTMKTVRMENGRPLVDAEAEFEYPAEAAAANPKKEKPKIIFTIAANGQLTGADGLDNLNPVERIAWQFWISGFAFGWTLPAEAWKQGQTMKNEEPENNPSPIGRLVWERETTYGDD